MKKRFFVQFITSITVVLIISTAFFFVICKGLRNTKRDTIGKFNYLISDTTYYNTVFFGSSRTHTHVNPVLFDSLAGTVSFNAGQDGIRMAEIDLIIQKFIKSHGAPKNVFINIDETTITTDKKVWYYPQYFPYVNDPAFNGLADIEPRLNFAKYFPALALTYFDDPLKNLGLLGFIKSAKADTIALKGFEPIGKHEFSYEPGTNDANFEMTDKAWPFFEETLRFCNANNIHTYIMIAPIYGFAFKSASVQRLNERLKQLQSKYDFKVLNFGGDQRFVAKDLYADQMHLNNEGANLYTIALAQEFLNRKN